MRALTAPLFQVTSVFGTMFPILSKRVPFLRRAIPGSLFDFVK